MSFSTLDWRRRIHDLYAQVRAEADPAAGHALWADGRNRLLSTHPASPVPKDERDGFGGVPVDAYDPALRFEVAVDTDVEPVAWTVDTGVDGDVPFSRLGIARLPGVGDLDVWWLESYGGGVFLPLRDTSPDTYGGGRYLLDTVKGADLGRDGALVVDLNFAYNPSCAYSPEWVCPLAPAGNRVDVAVAGGERLAPE